MHIVSEQARWRFLNTADRDLNAAPPRLNISRWPCVIHVYAYSDSVKEAVMVLSVEKQKHTSPYTHVGVS